ncbi:MAG: PIN domain-containing protein [Acidobacteria bacterium]|nr:PIN domain-containing protein [Acidobacteriota bacterium]
MIFPDANLLIYAYDQRSPFHPAAKLWLEHLFRQESRIAFSWATIQAFLRIMTNPRLHGAGQRQVVIRAIDDWLSHPAASIIEPGRHHWSVLASLIDVAGAFGPMITDAHLAALAIEYDATFCTHDRDFQRFPGLKLQYPLS